MLLNKQNLSFFIVLFGLFSSGIANASIFTDTSSCCDITFGPNGKISIGRNYDSTSMGSLKSTLIGDNLINKKLKQPYKKKYSTSKMPDYKQATKPLYNDRLKITETFKDDDTNDEVFEFYPSIQDNDFSKDAKTKDSNKQLYNF